MGWLEPIKPPDRYSAGWLRGYMETVRQSINDLSEGNVPNKWSKDTIISIGAEQIDVAYKKITTAQIENLIVGENVEMGSGASIQWSQITDGDDEALSAWASSGYSTYINSSGIYTGTVLADNISAGTITGSAFQTATAGARVVISTAGVLQLKYNDTTLVEYGGSGSYGWIGAASSLRIDAGDTVSIGEYSSSISLNCDSYYADGSANTEIATRGWVSGSYIPQTWISNTYDSHTHGTGSTGSDTTAVHNHGLLTEDYVYCKTGPGGAPRWVRYVSYAGDAHTHSIGTP